MQYLGYCTGCNSFNISHGLNLMLRKLTRHISMLAICVLQFLSYLFSSHFSSSAFPNLNFKKERLSWRLQIHGRISVGFSSSHTTTTTTGDASRSSLLIIQGFLVAFSLLIAPTPLPLSVLITGVTTTGGYRVSPLSLSSLFSLLFYFFQF